MPATYEGHHWFEGKQDRDGHRDYVLKCIIKTLTGEGPATVLACPGAPQPGQAWLVTTGTYTDIDVWAYCTFERKVSPAGKLKQGERPTVWNCEYTFTTRPNRRGTPGGSSGFPNRVENPLLEPQQVSGGSVRRKKFVSIDKDGKAIAYSSGEQILGPAVEFDASDSKITIKQNVANLEGYLVGSLLDKVNNAPLWGFPTRYVKFSSWHWSKNYKGATGAYYTRTFDFETSTKEDEDGVVSSGWDRAVLDESNKCLRGDWDRDPTSDTYERYVLADSLAADYTAALLAEDPRKVTSKPSNVVLYKNWYNDNSKTVLNGFGRPYRFPDDDEPVYPEVGSDDDTVKGVITIANYKAGNLLLLGIPVII